MEKVNNLNNHCHNNSGDKQKFDFLLWSSLAVIIILYPVDIFYADKITLNWLKVISGSVYSLINTIWWGIALGILMVGIISKIPQEFVISILGKGDNINGIIRATIAGLLLDLCSHGILMVGMQLYKRGAGIGQIMAFLIASPWNSFSLTLILAALIGIPWTAAFIILSMIIALITGIIFNFLVKKNKLPVNPNNMDLPKNFNFFKEAKKGIKNTKFNSKFFALILLNGLKDSKMVIRWILFGVILAGVIRASVSLDIFQTYFGATLSGLGLTILAATIIEVCSEGSTPIAADLLTRAKAPGNSFAFLMTGVSTDYTEIMSLKNTTKSWKISLFLPLITVPQIVLIGYIMNLLSVNN